MLISARPASQRNGIRQTHIPLAAQCGAQETKPTQRVGMNNGYYNEGRTWRCLVLNPSARTRAEPHNFLSHKLLLTNSNAELLEIQEGRHLLSRKGNPSQWKKTPGQLFPSQELRNCGTGTVEISSLPGIAPGCDDSLGSLRAPARAAPAEAVESFADQPRWQNAWNWNTEPGTTCTKKEQVGKWWIMFLAK